MKERQYDILKKYPRAQLGLMVNQCWYDDPKMVGVHMARYKFVGKMLAGKLLIAEIGSGDGMYSHIVKKLVEPCGMLHVYDFDPEWKSECPCTIVHDILDGPLTLAPYHAIYSLDTLEHITPKSEDTFLKNVVASLKEGGVFICGMPSLESQTYASPQSKEGHVNCKTQKDLKKLMQKYFKNVFMFGMNDEMIHTGYGPMCHYHIAIGTL